MEELQRMPEQLDAIIATLAKQGVTTFYTGGALGFDTLAAEAVLRARQKNPELRLILAIPCPDQTKGWRKAEKARYDTIRRQADAEYLLADAYDSGCMMRRNRFMVDRSAHCVFYLVTQRSGTYRTVSYAMEQGLQLHNILLI